MLRSDAGLDEMLAGLQRRIGDVEHRMRRMLRHGAVHAADYGQALVRCRHDTTAEGAPVLTGWIPWLTRRAGRDVDWWAPEVGEQVLILAPEGELALAMALPALYSDAHPAPLAVPSKHRVNYAGTAYFDYDRTAKRFTLDSGGGEVVLVGATETLTVV